jgi:hypothetical protein
LDAGPAPRLIRIQRSRLRENGAGPRLPAGFDLDAVITYVQQTLSLERVMAMASKAGWSLKLSGDSASRFGRDRLFVRGGA